MLFKYICLHFPLTTPPSPQPSPLPTLDPTPLWFCPCVLYRCSWKPSPCPQQAPAIIPSQLPLVTVSLFLIQCLWLYFACLFVLLIRFHLEVSCIFSPFVPSIIVVSGQDREALCTIQRQLAYGCAGGLFHSKGISTCGSLVLLEIITLLESVPGMIMMVMMTLIAKHQAQFWACYRCSFMCSSRQPYDALHRPESTSESLGSLWKQISDSHSWRFCFSGSGMGFLIGFSNKFPSMQLLLVRRPTQRTAALGDAGYCIVFYRWGWSQLWGIQNQGRCQVPLSSAGVM